MVRRLCLLLALAMIVGACTATGGESTTTTESDSGTTQTSAPAAATTTTSIEIAPIEILGIDDLPDEVQKELAELVQVTQELRELPFLRPPLVSVVTSQELEERVRSLIEEESESFLADEALYKLLGLLESDVDLDALLTDLYGEQVAGFYDGETGELVVPMREEGFSILQRTTMVHELTHSLTDQHFGFDSEMTELVDEDRLDTASAYQALYEGDASYTELLFVQTFSQRELGELFGEALGIESTSLEAAPEFIQDSLRFPYDTGLGFVQTIQTESGWEAVNLAYSIMPDLPGSTEQMITPGDYQRDVPIEVLVSEVPIEGYDLVLSSVWGELGFRIILSQVLGDADVLDAADGWGGDTYYQWFDGSNAAFLLVFVGDTAADTEEMRAALVDYAINAVAEEDFVWVEVIDDQLVFIAADETPVGEGIRAALKS